MRRHWGHSMIDTLDLFDIFSAIFFEIAIDFAAISSVIHFNVLSPLIKAEAHENNILFYAFADASIAVKFQLPD
jgi:hypothetical protein